MGKRALRSQARKVLKGAKRPYRNQLVGCTPRQIRRIISDWSVKPGDLVHDCDGFNHLVCEVRYQHTLYPEIILDRPDRFRCECGPVEPPRSQEEIQAFWERNAELDPDIRQWMDSGARVCDSQGRRIVPYREHS